MRTSQAKCAACGQTFQTLAHFDKHRRGEYGKGARYCVDANGTRIVNSDKKEVK